MENLIKEEVETILLKKDKLKIGSIDEGLQVITTGVVISFRNFGKKLMFVDIANPTNISNQIEEKNILGIILKNETISSERIAVASEAIKKGTIVLVKGYLEHTNKGQLLLHAQSFEIQKESTQKLQEIATEVQTNRVKKRTSMDTNFEEQQIAKKQKFVVNTIYEDSHIIIASKPFGMATHPTAPDITLIEFFDRKYVPVHRLDAATSGIVVLGKSKEEIVRVQDSINDKEHTIKLYLGLCQGIILDDEFSVEIPLSTKKGIQDAQTDFKVLHRFLKSNCTLLVAKLRTGRTHQIRRHLNRIDHPLVGDPDHGLQSKSSHLKQYGINRMCLHATYLKFIHPFTAKYVEIKDPLPADLLIAFEKIPDFDSSLSSKIKECEFPIPKAVEKVYK